MLCCGRVAVASIFASKLRTSVGHSALVHRQYYCSRGTQEHMWDDLLYAHAGAAIDGHISSWWWLSEVGSEVLLMRWNLFAVASPSTIRNQKLSVQRPCWLYLLISCLLGGQWGRWVAFSKAESKLYRLGVLVASLDDFLGIIQAKKGVRKLQTAWKSCRQPGFSSRGQIWPKYDMTTIGIVSSNWID